MSSHFKPVWGDATMARQLCHPYRLYFLAMPAAGFLVFSLFHYDPAVTTDIFSGFPPVIFKLLKTFFYIAVPRSTIELPSIAGYRSATYPYHAILMFDLCAFAGVILIINVIYRLDLSVVRDRFSLKQTIIRIVISTIFLFFQLPQFEVGSLKSDYVDSDGIWFLKASSSIGIGYYYECMLFVDFAARVLRNVSANKASIMLSNDVNLTDRR